jgi:hypothetical protein
MVSRGALIMLLLLALSSASLAHEHREVSIGGTETQWIVGWENEPAYSGILNAVQLIITTTDGKPVLGLEDQLRVEVTTGGSSIVLDLEPSDEVPGMYLAPIIPTVPGTYTFRFFGVVNGTEVNEVFTCGPSTFNCVGDSSQIQFPPQSSPSPITGALPYVALALAIASLIISILRR